MTPPADFSWQSVSPADAGFAPDLEEKLEYGLRSGLLRDLHAVLVLRSGRVVLERYFEGPDESWGEDLGVVSFRPDTLHDLRSVTKSVVSLLYGIALDRRLVPAPEARLLDHLPRYSDLEEEAGKNELTVNHALTMTLGLEWDEQGPYVDATNSEVAMEMAPDRLRFVLERPLESEPGTRWNYCGGATALLAGLITQGTGKTLAAFAQESLFEPIGITSFGWATGKDGVHSAASGLRLSARDLARIGELVCGLGEWEGRRIVSSDWVESSIRSAIPTGDGLEYGRQWFLGQARVPAIAGGQQRWVAGFGNGGQRLWILPAAGITTVIFSGNYNRLDAWVSPIRIWREIVLANFLEA